MTTEASETVVFGLGANLGDREATLRWALERLERLAGPLEVASLYRSAPVTARDLPFQPDYFNTVALGRVVPGSVALRPAAPAPAGRLAEEADDWRSLLFRLKVLERRAGRRLSPDRDTPRPLDIDLLLAGERIVDLPELPSAPEGRWPGALRIPHAQLRRRRFVLEPLAELVPDLRLPPDGERVGALLDALGDSASGVQDVERIGWSDPL